ncbi:MAG: TonB-dependent receptor [Labilithrix sp.]|nr:TonB-dependent receptor [Labilithrix sp.]MBX3211188.1 TonB-dependent receptor [Labilithrix sp.]
MDPGAASDIDIQVGQLGDVPRRNAEQLLTLAPGLFLSNPSGEGHASTIFLRGFDAGEGQDIDMRVEGVPINEPSNAHAHGYADTHFIIPELVDRLRVIEGPFDPRQGDFAVAGSIDYRLGLGHRGVMARGAYGSFNTRRFVALWGPAGTSRRTFAGVDFVEGNGFGTNRAHAATRAMAQYERAFGQGFTASLLATSYAGRFDTAGVIRQDDYAARRLSLCPATEEDQFFCLYDRNQGGGVARHGLSLRLEKRGHSEMFEQQVFATVRQLRVRQNLTGYVGDVSPTGEPQRGDGLEQSYGGVTVGGRGAYSRRIDALGRRHEVEIGYYARYDDADSAARRLRFADGVPYRVDLDNHLRITNVAFYAAGRFTPLSRLTLRGGLRLDTFAFSVVDRNRPTIDRSGNRLTSEAVEAFGIAVQPKLSADVSLHRQLHWITSVGIGSRSSDAQALSQGEFAPFARVRATESGLVSNVVESGSFLLNARAVAYHTRVERDLVFDETAGRNTPIGASNRFGGLGAARITMPFGIDTQTSITYAEAYVPPTGASELDLTAGARLPYVPRWVARIDASLRRSFRAFGETFRYNVASGFTYVAPRPLPFGQIGPAYGMLDVAVRFRYRMVELGLEGTNLFDRRNKLAVYNYASNFRGPSEFPSRLSQQHFAAGPPQMFMATCTLYFDAPEEEQQ